MPLLSKTVKKTTTTVVEENGKIVKTIVETVSEGNGEVQKELSNVVDVVEENFNKAKIVFYKGLDYMWKGADKLVKSLTEEK